MVYLSPAAILFIHESVLKGFGGAPGIRDAGALKSALARPRATFQRQPLYPGIFEKTAALLESLCLNHPFVDGNKRVAFVAAGLFLQQNGWTLDVETEDGVSFMLDVAAGNLDKDRIRIWLEERARPFRGA